jgi:hypothetical protein
VAAHQGLRGSSISNLPHFDIDFCHFLAHYHKLWGCVKT